MRAVVASVIAALAIGAAVDADAATYDVLACGASPAHGHAAWEFSNTSPSTIQVASTCPGVTGPMNGLSVSDIKGAPTDTPAAAIAGWTFTAPSPLRITRVRGQRYFGKADNHWWVGSRVDGQPKETCDFDPMTQFSCDVGASSGNEASFDYASLNAATVDFLIRCDAVAPVRCANGSTIQGAWVSVPAATVTIDDPSPPTVGVEAPSSGWRTSADIAKVTSSDASGVKTLGVVVDGTDSGNSPQSCDYERVSPCPANPSGSFTLSWPQLGDGVHEVHAVAADAAGQQASSSSVTVKVDTQAPEAPSGLAVVKQPSGSWRASWTNPPQGTASPIVGASWTVCQPGSTSDCVGGASHEGAGISSFDDVSFPPGGGPWDVWVWLRDEAGHQDRARGARLTVQTSPAPAIGSGTEQPASQTQRKNAGVRVDSLRLSGIRTLRLAGRIASKASGRLSVVLRTKRTGHAFATYRVTPRRGRYALVFRRATATKARQRLFITVVYRGDTAYAPTRVGGTLTPKRARSLTGASTP